MLEMKKKKQLKALEQQRIMNTVKKGLSAMEEVKVEDDGVVQAGINVRPYAKECLAEAVKLGFEIAIFTASH